MYLTLQATGEGQAAHAHVSGIVEGLRRRGWRVDLYEPLYGTSSPGAWERLAEFARVQRRLLPCLDGADAVYCRAHFASLPTALAAWRRGIPAVHEVNGTWEDLFLAWPLTRLAGRVFEGLARAQWRRASALVAVTPELAEWASGQARGTGAHVIPNAADTSLFTTEGPVAPGMPERYVVFVGALAPWQGLPTLLDATASPLWPEGVHAVVAGDGVMRPVVREAVAEGRPVVYLGRVPHREVPGVLRGALAAISAQDSGGGRSDTGLSPVKVYEALACGVPVVVSDYPGQADLVRSEGCGLVVPAEDPDLLASAVRRLAADPSTVRRMGERGRESAERSGSWDARAEETDLLLRGLVERSAATGGRRRARV